MKRMKSTASFFSTLAFLLLFSVHAWADALTLEEYRKQAQKADPAFQAAKRAVSGAHEAADSYTSATDAVIMGKAIYSDDQSPKQNPAFQGSRTRARVAALGVQKQFAYGPKLTLMQNFSHVEIKDASLSAIPMPHFYDWYPSAELNFPLLKNFGGRQVRAEVAKAKARVSAQSIQAELDYISATSRIDMAYYELFASRELLNSQKEILARAEKIRQWVSGQVSRGLLDSADLYQAAAAVTLRQIQLETALKSEAKSRRTFNSLRGAEGDQVNEVLQPQELIESSLLLSVGENRRRKEEILMQMNTEMQAQDYRLNAEMTRTTLDLVASSSWYGRDPDSGLSREESMESSRTNWYVGLQFATPLDVPKYWRVNRGLESLHEAQMLKARGMQRDQLLTWQEFIEQGRSLHTQLRLLRSLEETQLKKADAERVRLQLGRSTTFQVLNFEQDYISARSQRIQAELSARQYLHEAEKFD